MEGLRGWLYGLVATAMVLSVVYALVPKKIFAGIAKITGGLIMMLVLVRPVLGISWEDLDLRYRGYQEEIDRQIESYTAQNAEEMAAIIEQELVAYISEKAAQMGLHCNVRVETTLRDGIPQPLSVALNVQENEALSQWITDEIGIQREQQYWGSDI